MEGQVGQVGGGVSGGMNRARCDVGCDSGATWVYGCGVGCGGEETSVYRWLGFETPLDDELSKLKCQYPAGHRYRSSNVVA